MKSIIIYSQMGAYQEVLSFFDDYNLLEVGTSCYPGDYQRVDSYISQKVIIEKDDNKYKIEVRTLDPAWFVRGHILHPELPVDKVNEFSTSFAGNKNNFDGMKDVKTVYDDVVNHNQFLYLEPNSILILNRYALTNFLDITNNFNTDFKHKLYKNFKDNNIKLVIQGCWGEYSNNNNIYNTFEWFYSEKKDFKYLGITDNPHLESKEHMVYLEMGEMLTWYDISMDIIKFQNKEADPETWPIFMKKSIEENPKICDLRMSDYIFDHSDEKEYIFSYLTHHSLPHRINFINKLMDNDITTGYTSLDKNHYLGIQEEFSKRDDPVPSDMVYARGLNINKYFWRGWTKENYRRDWDEIKDFLSSPWLDLDTAFHQTESYFKSNLDGREWDKSYIDIFLETYIIQNVGFGYSIPNHFTTEKSIIPIICEKFFILVGNNNFYKLAKEIGIDTFLSQFGLEGFDEIDSPYEQSDEIIKFLLRIDKDTLKEMFISHREVFKENKRKFLKHFHNSLKPVQDFILDETIS